MEERAFVRIKARLTDPHAGASENVVHQWTERLRGDVSPRGQVGLGRSNTRPQMAERWV